MRICGGSNQKENPNNQNVSVKRNAAREIIEIGDTENGEKKIQSEGHKPNRVDFQFYWNWN